jgi:glycosyltransferase involved in cell wall biosynthesis/tetratricopeptide (TPR) repeat protein
MSLRYLFGPVSRTFADQNLHAARQSGDCLAFDSAGETDLAIGPADTWQTVLDRLPGGWRPDFIALDLHYTTVPPALWSAPVPLVGLAADWNLLFHGYRYWARRVDLLLTDTPGVEAFARVGVHHARAANLFGLERGFLEYAWPDVPRDIDVLFVGNLHPAVQRERLPWLGRLARLADRWRVAIRTAAFGDAYRGLLARSRVVFNRSLRAECNMRVFEAAVAGCLLFQEEGNREVHDYFRGGQECVYYTDANLEERLAHYLEHENERRARAEAALRRVREFSFAELWRRQVEAVERDWDEVVARSRHRGTLTPQDGLLGRTWEALSSRTGPEPGLVADLVAAVLAGDEPRNGQAAPVAPDADAGDACATVPPCLPVAGAAAMHNALGLAVTLAARGNGRVTAPMAANALHHFKQAVACDPAHVVAGLNYVECLVGVQQTDAAVAEGRRLLALLDAGAVPDAAVLDGGHFPPAFDHFRVEWERAAWANAGDPQAEARAKADVLRWRLHMLLAGLTGQLGHYEAAVCARPDLPPSRAMLGCALGRAGHAAEAVEHLRAAVDGNPFDLEAARGLYEALRLAGDSEGGRRLATERRLLARAAPQAVPHEAWFADSLHADPPQQPAQVQRIPMETFHRHFGAPDTLRAVCAFTNAVDTHVVLALLAYTRPTRILEVGTAAGHMTANLTEWSPDDALIYSLGTVADLAVPTALAQRYEDPPRASFGRFANAFGKVAKVFFVTADSLGYDFARLAPLDFAFVDGAHDRAHVLSDTRGAYAALRPGGCLVWHDYGSPTPWVDVHQAIAEAGLAEPVYHVAGTEVAFLFKGACGQPEPARPPAAPPTRPPEPTPEAPQPDVVLPAASPAEPPTPRPGQAPAPPEPSSGPLAVVWEGDHTGLHSLALVNRELCLGLVRRGHHLAILPPAQDTDPNIPAMPAVTELDACVRRPLGRPADAHVRHAWPPNFQPPPEGHWVVMQPWEHGSLPRAWAGPLSQDVDDVWAYSRYVRDCYLAAGVPPDRVHVVPLGIDPDRFRPGLPALPLQTRRRYKFLFVGGTIRRKGIDLLLDAYGRAFTDKDDVCLVVKDMGVGTFYRGQTAGELIARFQAQPSAPAVEYRDEPLRPDELPGLYAACDCLVQPYRGEGFGLPIAEAMACGLPAVVTGHGAALDYCTPDSAYLVPARIVRLPEKRLGDIETVDHPWHAECDVGALARLLRHVVAHPDEARARGGAASEYVRRNVTWDHAAAAAEARLQALRDLPIRRSARGPGLVTGKAVRPAVTLLPLDGRPLLTLCIIARNEEANLAACLRSAAGLFGQVVVVDTGSTDRTREVAREFGAEVYDFPWCDDFAAARNEALRHARGRWIFWLDADDFLSEDDRNKLRRLFASLGDDPVGYVMKCLCLADGRTRSETAVDHVRLFPNHPQIRWRWRVHEQILAALREHGVPLRWSDAVVRHTGYRDPAVKRRKLERDLRLLLLEYAANPDHPFTLFNLAGVCEELGRPEEALPYIRRSLALSHPQDSIVRKLYVMLSRCLRLLGQLDEALAALREGRGHYPQDAELLYQEGIVREQRGDLPGAAACWLELLETRDGDHFASVDPALRGYKARHRLGEVCYRMGRPAEAEAQWRAALAEQPDYLPALHHLRQLLHSQGRSEELEQVQRKIQELEQKAVA